MSDNGDEKRYKQEFSIIKQRGSPTKATTLDGHKVEKQEWVVCENPFDNKVPPEMVKIQCMDYHNEHFVYLDPVNVKNRWFAWCTCGSPAVIIEPAAYKTDNLRMACYFHAQFGRHVTGDGRGWQ
jgi:hypothetical protein